jgi:hypothetical protein
MNLIIRFTLILFFIASSSEPEDHAIGLSISFNANIIIFPIGPPREIQQVRQGGVGLLNGY